MALFLVHVKIYTFYGSSPRRISAGSYIKYSNYQSTTFTDCRFTSSKDIQ